MMVPPVVSPQSGARFDHRGPAKFTSPDNQRILEQAAPFEILNQGSASLVRLSTLPLDPPFDIAVMIPPRMVHLNEPHPAFGETPRQKTVVRKCFLTVARVRPVEVERFSAFLGKVHQLWSA